MPSNLSENGNVLVKGFLRFLSQKRSGTAVSTAPFSVKGYFVMSPPTYFLESFSN